MKNKTFLTISLFAFTLNSASFAQPSIEWTKTFQVGESSFGNLILQTKDLGFIVLCQSYSIDTREYDVVLVKLDKMANVEWQKSYGGAHNDYANGIIQIEDGSYLISGTTYSYGNGESDIWLFKVDEYGNLIWNKTFGGEYRDSGRNVIATHDGDYIIAGTRGGENYEDSEAFLVKVDSSGIEEWIRVFNDKDKSSGIWIQPAVDSGFVYLWQSDEGNIYQNTIWLMKIDKDGNEIYKSGFDGSEQKRCLHFQQTSDNGYIVTGCTYASDVSEGDLWLFKTDDKGNIEWSKTFGEFGVPDIGEFVEQTSDQGYIVTGTTYNQNGCQVLWLLKTDSDGHKIWSMLYDRETSSSGNAVIQTKDDGYLVTGSGTSNDGVAKILVVKMKENTSSSQKLKQIESQYVFDLKPNYPNPFNNSTRIEYSIESRAFVTLDVFNALGQRVAILVNEYKEPGNYTGVLNSLNLSTGIYLYRLKTQDFIQYENMTLLK